MLQLIRLPRGRFHLNQSLCCHPTWAVALVTRPQATRAQGLSQDCGHTQQSPKSN